MATLVPAALAISPARADDKPAEIRIGGFFPAVRQSHTVEDAFKPLGIEIKWIDFQSGPPLLEAINVGSVDFIFQRASNDRLGFQVAMVVVCFSACTRSRK